MTENEIWSIETAAEYLCVGVQAVRSYIRKGWLTPLRNPDGTGPIRFSAEEVRSFFANSAPDKQSC